MTDKLQVSSQDSFVETTPTVQRIHTSGVDNEYIHLGDNTVVRRDELVEAFGGTLSVGLHRAPTRSFGNATALGLASFSLPCFVYGLCMLNTRSVGEPYIMFTVSIFLGGMVEILAAMWELILENTFAAVVFGCFGGFWLSFPTMYMEPFNVYANYTDKAQFSSGLGLFLMGYLIFTLLITLATIRSTWAMFILFVCVDLLLITGIVNSWAPSAAAQNAHGAFACLSGLLGWYNMLAGIVNKENAYFNIRPIYMPGAHRVSKV